MKELSKNRMEYQRIMGNIKHLILVPSGITLRMKNHLNLTMAVFPPN